MDETKTNSEKVDFGAPPESHRFEIVYTGKSFDLALLMLKNIVLNLVTLTLYSGWAKTRTRRYLWSNLSFGGDFFVYHGTGLELFLGRLQVGLVVLGYVFIAKGMKRIGPYPSLIFTLIGAVSFWLLIPYLIYWARTYRLSRTRWRNVRFGMKSDGALEFAKTFWKGAILTGLSLGLYTAFFKNNIHRIKIANTRFGSKYFDYTGQGKDLFWSYVKAFFFGILTLGFYMPWFYVHVFRYRAEHTFFDGAQMHSNISGGDLFRIFLMVFLLVPLTLGLSLPWVMTYSLNLIASKTWFEGNIDFSSIVNTPSQGSGAADAGGDIAHDFGIGVGF